MIETSTLTEEGVMQVKTEVRFQKHRVVMMELGSKFWFTKEIGYLNNDNLIIEPSLLVFVTKFT